MCFVIHALCTEELERLVYRILSFTIRTHDAPQRRTIDYRLVWGLLRLAPIKTHYLFDLYHAYINRILELLATIYLLIHRITLPHSLATQISIPVSGPEKVGEFHYHAITIYRPIAFTNNLLGSGPLPTPKYHQFLAIMHAHILLFSLLAH